MTWGREEGLADRRSERGTLDRLVAAVRGGQSQALVVRGDPGVGKTALLDSALAGPLDDRVRDRIVSETQGNPLALLELPKGLTPTELAGGFGLPGAMPLSERIAESFRRQLEALPAQSRRLVLLAAAEPYGDLPQVWRAAERPAPQAGAYWSQ